MSCGGVHVLRSQGGVRTLAKELIHRLDITGTLDYESARPKEVFSREYLFTKGPGRMLGVMVCMSTDGMVHMLRGFSGQITEEWHIPGWVGPMAGITHQTAIYQDYRDLVYVLNNKIAQLDIVVTQSRQHTLVGSHRYGGAQSGLQEGHVAFVERQRDRLKQVRKKLSHELLRKVHDSYVVTTFSGHQVPLRDVYLQYAERHEGTPVSTLGPWKTFPAGTGDCCAPKLIHAAVSRGLVPLTMVEFWYGAAPGGASPRRAQKLPEDRLREEVIDEHGARVRRAHKSSRQSQAKGSGGPSRGHGECYGMCEKCQAILGTMLCGIDAARASLVVPVQSDIALDMTSPVSGIRSGSRLVE